MSKTTGSERNSNANGMECSVAQQYAPLLDILQFGILCISLDGTVAYSNAAANSILDLSPAHISEHTWDKPVWRLIRPDHTPLPFADGAVSTAIRTKSPVQNHVVGIVLPNRQNPKWLFANATPILQEDNVSEVFVTFIDITETKKDFESLAQTDVRFRDVFDNTPLGMCITDSAGYFEVVNNAYCSFYGYSREELQGRHFTMVVPQEHKEELAAHHDAFIQGGAELRGEWEVVASNGAKQVILADAVRIQDNQGAYKKVTFIMDISNEKRLQRELELKNEQLERLNRIDPLTQLTNRRHIMDCFDAEVERLTRYPHIELSIALLDIDHFKQVNDSHGHQCGDAVLARVASLIQGSVRRTDYVGRYGGEEFLVLLPETSLEGAVALMERVRHTIAENRDNAIRVTISCGVTQYQGEGVLACIDQADKNLYEAKRAGRNRVVDGG